MYTLPSVSESNWIQGNHGFKNPQIFKAICLYIWSKLSPLVVRMEWPFQRAGLDYGTWRTCVAQISCLPPALLAVPARFKAMQDIIFGTGLAAGVAGKLSELTANRLIQYFVCDSGAPDHDIRRRMIFAKSHRLHSLEAILKHLSEKPFIYFWMGLAPCMTSIW